MEEWGVFLCYATHRIQLNIPDDCLLEEKRRSSTLENKHKGKSVLITSRNEGDGERQSKPAGKDGTKKNEVEILKGKKFMSVLELMWKGLTPGSPTHKNLLQLILNKSSVQSVLLLRYLTTFV